MNRIERADLELVLHVRDRGSLAAAAAALGVVPSVVTKRLAALEARLAQRLFERTTRRLVLTREGEAVCEHAQRLLEGFDALDAELTERRQALAGTIRLAATLGFGRRWVGPVVAAFQARHPAVRIDLRLTEQLPDLAREGFDGAVWLWHMQATHLADWTTRRLGRNQRVLVAAPAYVQTHGLPATPEALAQHACLRVNEGEDATPSATATTRWTLRHGRDGSLCRVRVNGPLASNSGELVRDWCLAGHGIALRSLWDVAPHLASGQLLRVLPNYAMTDADVHWLAPWQPRTPRRVRLLLDALAEGFRGEPWNPARARP